MPTYEVTMVKRIWIDIQADTPDQARDIVVKQYASGELKKHFDSAFVQVSQVERYSDEMDI